MMNEDEDENEDEEYDDTTFGEDSGVPRFSPPYSMHTCNYLGTMVS